MANSLFSIARMAAFIFAYTLCSNIIVTSVHCRLQFGRFKATSCPDIIKNETLTLDAMTTVANKSRQTTSALECAISCNKDAQCDLAIYRQNSSSLIPRCWHISESDAAYCTTIGQYPSTTVDTVNNTDPTDSDEKRNCSILLKTPQTVDCQNEEAATNTQSNLETCGNGAWRLAREEELEMLTNSHLQINAVTVMSGSKIRIFQVQHFEMTADTVFNLNVQSTGFKWMNEPTGVLDPSDFKGILYYSDGDSANDTHARAVYMFGLAVWTDPEFMEYSFMIRDSIDDNRLVFLDGVYGTVDELLDGLSKGYRLITREPTRVGFDKQSGDVFFESVTGVLGLERWYGLLPFYVCAKTTLKSKTSFKSRRYVRGGMFKDSYNETANVRWELDKCWVKLNDTSNYDDFTTALKEIVLGGSDVRVVMKESWSVWMISSDVTTVTATTNDVIATLAHYLTPFDEINPLNESSRVRYPVISRSHVFSECEKQFENVLVYHKTSHNYQGHLEWFYSSRPRTKIFETSNSGLAVSGSRLDMYEAAIRGRDLRVCVEVSPDTAWRCSGSAVTKVDNTTQEVRVQTPAAMNLDVDLDMGIFTRIADASCAFHVMVVSTDGWVKNATYNPGGNYTTTGISNTAVSWFVEL